MFGTFMNDVTMKMSGNNDKICIRLLVLHGAVCLLGIKGHFGNLRQKNNKVIGGNKKCEVERNVM